MSVAFFARMQLRTWTQLAGNFAAGTVATVGMTHLRVLMTYAIAKNSRALLCHTNVNRRSMCRIPTVDS